MVAKLDGRVAIVAGAGSGVGRAVARRFAEAGARLMLADADDAGLDETAAAIEAPAGHLARFGQAIEDKLGVNNLIAATLNAFERIDILVTAVPPAAPAAFFELTPEAFEAALAQSLNVVFLQTQLVARRMVEQREADPAFRGAIVTVSTVAARRTVPDLVAHSVAMAALDQLTRALAVALAPERIRVNGVALGAVMTPGLRAALAEGEALREAIATATPLGRVGEAEEAAEAALFLASPGAGFVTGQIVAVDGGRLALDPLAAPVR